MDNRVERIRTLLQQKAAIDAELAQLKAAIKEEAASLRAPRKPRKKKEGEETANV
jgi:hypothetical protein